MPSQILILNLVALLAAPSLAKPVARSSTDAFCDAFTKVCTLWPQTTSSCRYSTPGVAASSLSLSCKSATGSDVTSQVLAMLGEANTAVVTSTAYKTIKAVRTRTRTVRPPASTNWVKVMKTAVSTVTAGTVTSNVVVPTTTTVTSTAKPWLLPADAGLVVADVEQAVSSLVAAATAKGDSILTSIVNSGSFIVKLSGPDIMRREQEDDEGQEVHSDFFHITLGGDNDPSSPLEVRTEEVSRQSSEAGETDDLSPEGELLPRAAAKTTSTTSSKSKKTTSASSSKSKKTTTSPTKVPKPVSKFNSDSAGAFCDLYQASCSDSCSSKVASSKCTPSAGLSDASAYTLQCRCTDGTDVSDAVLASFANNLSWTTQWSTLTSTQTSTKTKSTTLPAQTIVATTTSTLTDATSWTAVKTQSFWSTCTATVVSTPNRSTPLPAITAW